MTEVGYRSLRAKMDKKTVKERQKARVEAYTKSRFEGSNTPEETISILEDTIGHREAILAVAELVNTVGSWDVRVSDRVRSWASGIEEATSPDELKAIGVYQPSEIHPAHIENLGSWLCATRRNADEKKNLSYVHAPVCVVREDGSPCVQLLRGKVRPYISPKFGNKRSDLQR